MPEPSITSTVADIYAADLLYEQNAKCGTIRVLSGADTFEASVEVSDTSAAWKIMCINNATIDTVEATNISVADCAKITSLEAGTEIMGAFTKIVTSAGVLMIYRDCSQS